MSNNNQMENVSGKLGKAAYQISRVQWDMLDQEDAFIFELINLSPSDLSVSPKNREECRHLRPQDCELEIEGVDDLPDISEIGNQIIRKARSNTSMQSSLDIINKRINEASNGYNIELIKGKDWSPQIESFVRGWNNQHDDHLRVLGEEAAFFDEDRTNPIEMTFDPENLPSDREDTLTLKDKVILNALYEKSEKDDSFFREARVSLESLADEAGLDSIHSRDMDRLRRKGWIEKEANEGPYPNTYYLLQTEEEFNETPVGEDEAESRILSSLSKVGPVTMRCLVENMTECSYDPKEVKARLHELSSRGMIETFYYNGENYVRVDRQREEILDSLI